MRSTESQSAIQDFYRGCNVFVTGFSGFVGKCLVEKLLRSCDIGTIYVLLRGKKGKTIDQRLDEILQNPIMEGMASKFKSKIYPVMGDVALPGLGISPSDRTLLKTKVDVVFHGAATVHFNETLSKAITINVQGTLETLNLAKEMENLKAFIYISTAFSQCIYTEIEEKIYDSPLPYQNLLTMLYNVPSNITDVLSERIIAPFPNTYVFSKAVTEFMLHTEGQNIPLAIVRPSMILGTADEPIRGWVDNVYGPTGYGLGVALGLLRVGFAEGNAEADIVPVDKVINCVIAVPWDIHNNSDNQFESHETPVYNFVSSYNRSTTWNWLGEIFKTMADDIPSIHNIHKCSYQITTNPFIFCIYELFLHVLPAVLIDFIMVLLNKKPRLLRAYRKIHSFIAALAYFSCQAWTFHNSRVSLLWSKLDCKDKKIFQFNLKSLDLLEYMFYFIRGGRVYLVKDDMSTIPAAKAKLKRLIWFDRVLKILFLCLLLWCIKRYI